MLEIERKFLIKMPNIEAIKKLNGIRILNITQNYTESGARIRKVQENGHTTYIKTVKKHVTNLTRIEDESEIFIEEYTALLETKQGGTIEKTRYVYPYKSKNIEIDVFPFWQNQAFLEVELKSEKEEFEIPAFIEVIKEVTDDKAYRNYALSKKIPKEEKF